MNAQSEARIEHELYRVFKDAIIEGVRFDNYSVIDIEPQFRVGKGEIADLVVTVEGLYGRKEILIVLEVKRRPKTVTPYATGVKQALQYAKSLNAWFFAVCDGWFMLPFRSVVNKLVGAYAVEMSIYYAQNFLAGLIEYHWKEKSDYLNKLPRAPDSFYLNETLLPSLNKIQVNVSEWRS